MNSKRVPLGTKVAPLLEIHNLSVVFKHEKRTIDILRGVSFSIDYGRALSLVGESGSGKSVLARSILRLLPRSGHISGTVLWKGQNISSLSPEEMVALRGKGIGLVLQNPDLALNPLRTVGSQMIEPLLLWGFPRRTAREKASSLLNRLGFLDPERILGSYPHRLSGGMNQRVLIAASMMLEPEVLIVDEPTKGLDEEAKELVERELSLLRETFSTEILLITHDLSVPSRLTPWTGALYGGELVELSDTESFFHDPLHPYVQDLLEALPENGFHPISGLPYSPLSAPTGCRFHPRCRRRMTICEGKAPEDISIGERRVRCHLYA